MRGLVADVRERLIAVLDRAHPGMLIGAGLAVVALVFGALGLAILRDRESGVDDLGLRSPEAPAAADDFGESGAGDDASADGRTPFADGLAEEAGTGRTSDGGADGPDGSGASASGASGASGEADASAAPGGGSSSAAPSERQPSTTVARSEPTTTTAPSTTTSPPPPSTTATTVAEPHPGLIGGLLDVLGLGG